MLYLRGKAGTRRDFNCYIFLILNHFNMEHIQSLLSENDRPRSRERRVCRQGWEKEVFPAMAAGRRRGRLRGHGGCAAAESGPSVVSSLLAGQRPSLGQSRNPKR